MIDSYTATSVIVGFLVIFGVILPIIDKIPKIRDIVSFRWTIVVIYSALAIGVIIDFAHLDTSVRFAVVIGGIILSALFLIVRSIEKAAVNNWKLPRTRASVKKGNVSAELSLHPRLNAALNDNNESSELELAENEDPAIEFNQKISSYLTDDKKIQNGLSDETIPPVKRHHHQNTNNVISLKKK